MPSLPSLSHIPLSHLHRVLHPQVAHLFTEIDFAEIYVRDWSMSMNSRNGSSHTQRSHLYQKGGEGKDASTQHQQHHYHRGEYRPRPSAFLPHTFTYTSIHTHNHPHHPKTSPLDSTHASVEGEGVQLMEPSSLKHLRKQFLPIFKLAHASKVEVSLTEDGDVAGKLNNTFTSVGIFPDVNATIATATATTTTTATTVRPGAGGNGVSTDMDVENDIGGTVILSFDEQFGSKTGLGQTQGPGLDNSIGDGRRHVSMYHHLLGRARETTRTRIKTRATVNNDTIHPTTTDNTDAAKIKASQNLSGYSLIPLLRVLDMVHTHNALTHLSHQHHTQRGRSHSHSRARASSNPNYPHYDRPGSGLGPGLGQRSEGADNSPMSAWDHHRYGDSPIPHSSLDIPVSCPTTPTTHKSRGLGSMPGTGTETGLGEVLGEGYDIGGLGVGVGVLAPASASASSSSSSFGNKIWGLRVVDMRLLMTVDMRDRLFGYVLKFQEYFTYDDIDGFRPRRLPSSSSSSSSLREDEEAEEQHTVDQTVDNSVKASGTGLPREDMNMGKDSEGNTTGGGAGGEGEKKKVKVLTDDDLKATARDFLPYWDKNNEKGDSGKGTGVGKEGMGGSGGRGGSRERGGEVRGERRRSRSTGSLSESRSYRSKGSLGEESFIGEGKLSGSERSEGLALGSALGSGVGLENERGEGIISGSRSRRSVSVDRGGSLGGGGGRGVGGGGRGGGGSSITSGRGTHHSTTISSSSSSLSAEYRHTDDVRTLLRMGVEGSLDGSERLSRVREREKFYWGDTSQVTPPQACKYIYPPYSHGIKALFLIFPSPI